MSLPLPPNYFKCPPLAPEEKEYLLSQSKHICQETALNALTMARNPPVKVVVNPSTKRRAQIHYGVDIIDSSLYGATGSTQLRTSSEEIIDFFHLNSPKKVRAYGQVVGQVVLDRVTLYNLADKTIDPKSPCFYAGVVWSAIACPFISTSLTLKRDTCFFEVLDSITVKDPATGKERRGVIRALHTVALDCCPSLRETHNIVRSALIRSGHVFLESDEPGLFDYYYTYIVADPGKTPKYINLKVFQRIVGQVLNLEYYFALQRLPNIVLAVNQQRIPFKSTRTITYCEACDRKFKVMRTKNHCYRCRQVVCRSCIQTYKVPASAQVTLKVALCTYCFCGNSSRRNFANRWNHEALATVNSSQTSASDSESELNSPWYISARTASIDSSVASDDMWTNNRPTLRNAASTSDLLSESSFASMSLPLAPNYFHCQPLSASERQALVQQAHQICFHTARNAVSMAAKGPPVKVLVHAQTKRRLNIYHGHDVIDSTLDGVTGVTQVKASFEEIADFFNLNSAKSVKTYSKVFALSTVDRCSLYTLRRSTKRSLKYAGISWIALDSPFVSKAIVKRRDSCILEAIREYEMQCPLTNAPRKCWVKAVHSLEMDCCPSLERSHGIVRGRLVRSGHVFMETEIPGVLNYFLVYIGEAYGAMPRFIQQKCLQKMLPPMLHLEIHLNKERLSFYFLHHPIHPINKNKKSSQCGSCRTAFSYFHGPKTQCQVCEEMICKTCTQACNIELRQSKVRVMVCQSCIRTMRPRTEFNRQHHAPSTTITMSMVDIEASHIGLDPATVSDAAAIERAFGLHSSDETIEYYEGLTPSSIRTSILFGQTESHKIDLLKLSSMTLPLPPNFFPSPKLQPLHRANLITKAHEVVQDTVKNIMEIVKNPVAKVLVNKATRCTANLHDGYDLKDNSLIGVVGVTQIHATFDEIAEFYDTSSPRKLRLYASVAGQAILDKCTLYTLVDKGSDLHRPLTSVKIQWSVMECPSWAKAMTLKRDACYLECLSENFLEDPKTNKLRRAWVRVLHSVDLPCCPSLQASHNFVRGYLVRSGQVFVESDTPGVLDFYWSYIADPSGLLPRLIQKEALRRLVGQILNLEQHFCHERISRYMAEQPICQPRKHAPKTSFCERCDKKFGSMSTKTQCHKCGWIVCKRCVRTWSLNIEGDHVSTPICTHCFCDYPEGSFAMLEDDKTSCGDSQSSTSSGGDGFSSFKTIHLRASTESEVEAVWSNMPLQIASSTHSSQSSFSPYI
ncbi:hypothetical protein THRCLA_06416 [Thraustotheca clavata]|uniref:FYVE-type domain-containing protein n=1 Tax=Thraustotheca clavata TaxID=74557 RepID=A0A1V9ZP20_9STRA|nr:hypothetical protein THRCLA_06416 [Thraustotheca clavata]